VLPAPAAEAKRGEEVVSEKAAPLAYVEGRVLGIDDAGIPGAVVGLFTGPDAAADGWGTLGEILNGRWTTSRPVLEVRTGPDGTFRLPFSPEPRAAIRAEAPGYAAARIGPVALLSPVSGLAIRLQAPLGVSGTVVRAAAGGAATSPLEGVRVLVLDAARDQPCLVLGVATTDAAGRFEAVAASRRHVTVVAVAEGMTPAESGIVTVPAEDVVVRMEPATLKSLKGVVFLPDGTTPAAGVRVTVTTRPPRRPAPAVLTTVTEEDGRFAFDAVEASDVRSGCPLDVVCDGGARGVGFLERNPWPGDSDERIVLVEPPDGVLSGRVVSAGPDGNRLPVAGVLLLIRGSWETQGRKVPVERRVRTPPDGTFRETGLPGRDLVAAILEPVRRWRFVQPDRGLLPWRSESGPWEVEILLEEAPEDPRTPLPTSVGGRVFGPGGEPVAGALVVGFGPAVLTDERGAFLLHGEVTRAGAKVSLQVSADGFPTLFADPLLLLPGAGPTDFQFTFRGTLRALVGRVVDGGGEPVGGATVRLLRPGAGKGEPAAVTRSRANGAFRFTVDAGSEWRIEVSAPGRQPASLERALAGDSLPDLVLR
jgi:hypothetical protein